MRDYGPREVNPDGFTVLTVIPHSGEPKYQEYDVPAHELPSFLIDIEDDPEIAERVVTITEKES